MIQNLPDVQNRADERGVPLDRVGITGVYFPVKVLRKDGEIVSTNATHLLTSVSAKVDLYVGLPHDYKGVNMSRFMESLIDIEKIAGGTVSSQTMPSLLYELRARMKSEDAYARFEFDYYLNRPSPVTKKDAPMRYRCSFSGILKSNPDRFTFILEANVVAAALCPCSREMSLLKNLSDDVLSEDARDSAGFGTYLDILARSFPAAYKHVASMVGMGAHNQRSIIRVKVVSPKDKFLWLEDLVGLIEAQASAPTYPLLKRADEKFATEKAYNNAKFSEDITRDVHLALLNHECASEWHIRVVNEESIHPFDVTCYKQSEGWNNITR